MRLVIQRHLVFLSNWLVAATRGKSFYLRGFLARKAALDDRSRRQKSWELI
jgi:hypothetical protein